MTIRDVENINVREYEKGEIKNYKGVYNRYIKRILDICISLISIVILFPIIIVLCVAVYLDDGWPIFYCPYRGGYKGQKFKIIKFRTMVKNADKMGGGTTAFHDPRITRLGRILRKTKLDELPQLFNILKGDMSLIGPRPELLAYTSMYRGVEEVINEVRPGITDFGCIYITNLDEICGNENADEIYERYILRKKNLLRIQYVAEVSFHTDCYIFCYTVYVVIKKYIIKFFKDSLG